MAITYKWDIPQMNAHIQSEGEDNVIYTVHYRYTGSEESGGETYSSTNIGTQSYEYVAGEPFVPYEDTEAFEAVLPELVLESPETGLKSVAYSELTSVLINAIKEQQDQIEDLKTRITQLEN